SEQDSTTEKLARDQLSKNYSPYATAWHRRPKLKTMTNLISRKSNRKSREENWSLFYYFYGL
ncbi:hypothetical protein ACQP3D_29230, partial [Escherichia coli]